MLCPYPTLFRSLLHDLGIIDQIVRAIDPQPQDRIIEIGPVLSALTRPLLWRVPQLTAIEIDRDLVAQLRQHPDLKSLEVIQADVLEVDFKPFGDNLRIGGNLPYNISSPLLVHLLQ